MTSLVGAGGEPEALPTRAGHLVRPSGQVVADVEPAGVATRSMTTRLESARGVSPWFAWARVGADHFEPLAATAGLQAIGLDVVGERWLGRAVRS